MTKETSRALNLLQSVGETGEANDSVVSTPLNQIVKRFDFFLSTSNKCNQLFLLYFSGTFYSRDQMDSFDNCYSEDSRSEGYNDCHKIIKGNTPCFLAVKAARYEALLFLLERNADPNVMFSEHRYYDNCYVIDNETYPLIIAVEQGDLEITRLLLRYGANPNVRCSHKTYEGDNYFKEKYTALELAIHLKKQDIVALLENERAENFYYSEDSEIYSDEYVDEDGRYCGTRDQCKTIRYKRDGEKIVEWQDV